MRENFVNLIFGKGLISISVKNYNSAVATVLENMHSI